jgi:hypothetical protein
MNQSLKYCRVGFLGVPRVLKYLVEIVGQHGIGHFSEFFWPGYAVRNKRVYMGTEQERESILKKTCRT